MRVHGVDRREADARRLDDVDGLDADVRTDVAGRGRLVPLHVGAMMVAMMLPSLVPTLWRYRQAVSRTGDWCLGQLTALVSAGVLPVWTVFGIAAFLLGVALAAVEMQLPEVARAVPIAAGLIVLIAGVLQFSTWKAHHLAYSRDTMVYGCKCPQTWARPGELDYALACIAVFVVPA